MPLFMMYSSAVSAITSNLFCEFVDEKGDNSKYSYTSLFTFKGGYMDYIIANIRIGINKGFRSKDTYSEELLYHFHSCHPS